MYEAAGVGEVWLVDTASKSVLVYRRSAPDRVSTLADLYPGLAAGELVTGTQHPLFKEAWRLASAESFSAR